MLLNSDYIQIYIPMTIVSRKYHHYVFASIIENVLMAS